MLPELLLLLLCLLRLHLRLRLRLRLRIRVRLRLLLVLSLPHRRRQHPEVVRRVHVHSERRGPGADTHVPQIHRRPGVPCQPKPPAPLHYRAASVWPPQPPHLRRPVRCLVHCLVQRPMGQAAEHHHVPLRHERVGRRHPSVPRLRAAGPMRHPRHPWHPRHAPHERNPCRQVPGVHVDHGVRARAIEAGAVTREGVRGVGPRYPVFCWGLGHGEGGGCGFELPA
mmetsp:Transcript_69797/g.221075  ORF Transcript_69797/g.221075 Transcript_69797/m.221075 type:complete len:225 (+) Transcript_69797:746-1420(+)